MTEKNYFLKIWCLRTKEVNLNISFKIWLDVTIFKKKWSFWPKTLSNTLHNFGWFQISTKFQKHKISKWECLTFGWLFKKGKIPNGRSLSLSQWKPTSYLYIWDDVHSYFIHRKMNFRMKRASASPSLPRSPSIIFFLWLFLLFQESTAENATLDPSEGISLYLSLFFVCRIIMTCFLGLWWCGYFYFTTYHFSHLSATLLPRVVSFPIISWKLKGNFMVKRYIYIKLKTNHIYFYFWY